MVNNTKNKEVRKEIFDFVKEDWCQKITDLHKSLNDKKQNALSRATMLIKDSKKKK